MTNYNDRFSIINKKILQPLNRFDIQMIRRLIEAEAESPEAYVEQNKRFPIRDISRTSDGGMVITTGNESGYIVRYTFTEE